MAIRTKEMLLTSKEAAEFLGLEPNTIPKYVRRKLLVPYSQVGRSFVFSKSECERFKETRRSPGNPAFQKKTEAKQKGHRRKTVA